MVEPNEYRDAVHYFGGALSALTEQDVDEETLERVISAWNRSLEANDVDTSEPSPEVTTDG